MRYHSHERPPMPCPWTLQQSPTRYPTRENALQFRASFPPYEQREYTKERNEMKEGKKIARRRTSDRFLSCPADPAPGYDADAVSVVLDWNRRYPLRLRWHGWVHLSTRHSLHRDLALWISDPTRMRCPTWQHSCHRIDMPSRWFSWPAPHLPPAVPFFFFYASYLTFIECWLPEGK